VAGSGREKDAHNSKKAPSGNCFLGFFEAGSGSQATLFFRKTG
jgi:hypothetical protein